MGTHMAGGDGGASAGATGKATAYQLQFRRAVTINEEIKRIVGISHEVNLAAINAMLIAKRAGHAAAGFSVVSVELRGFSQRLDGLMGEVRELVSGLVMEGAVLSRQCHRQALLESIDSPMIEAARADKVVTVAQLEQQLLDRQSRLLHSLGRAQKLCGMGVAISRSAKIESSYGRDMASALQQVSNQVEAAIQGIVDTVKLLSRLLQGQAA